MVLMLVWRCIGWRPGRKGNTAKRNERCSHGRPTGWAPSGASVAVPPSCTAIVVATLTCPPLSGRLKPTRSSRGIASNGRPGWRRRMREVRTLGVRRRASVAATHPSAGEWHRHWLWRGTRRRRRQVAHRWTGRPGGGIRVGRDGRPLPAPPLGRLLGLKWCRVVAGGRADEGRQEGQRRRPVEFVSIRARGARLGRIRLVQLGGLNGRTKWVGIHVEPVGGHLQGHDGGREGDALARPAAGAARVPARHAGRIGTRVGREGRRGAGNGEAGSGVHVGEGAGTERIGVD